MRENQYVANHDFKVDGHWISARGWLGWCGYSKGGQGKAQVSGVMLVI